MRIRESMTTQGPYVVSLCGATIPAPWNDLEVLPPTCKVAEPLLAALFHFLTALRVPATCVIAAGFKPGRLQDVSTSTLPVVSQLGPVVARGLSCAFAAEAPGGLEASAAWHGTADDALDGSVMFL
ncbi:unnamed protein product [Ostreobium quekettii]|uniref:Uncharacterized protein n=1 Tax=Ostreobium quekettii TaxID=121088 RepID=A0A8S1JDV7_9CHLO|nr:unnamed protein product [Ostreobium quekettii]